MTSPENLDQPVCGTCGGHLQRGIWNRDFSCPTCDAGAFARGPDIDEKDACIVGLTAACAAASQLIAELRARLAVAEEEDLMWNKTTEPAAVQRRVTAVIDDAAAGRLTAGQRKVLGEAVERGGFW